MGRPPGVKNGAGNHGAAKQGSKPAAGGGGGKSVGKTCNSAATGGATDKEKTLDRSQSNFPYDIRLNSYASLHNAVTKGTPKIKRILTEECDYIMECRVCRNLFRSLPNFITHKVNYCKKAFDATWCLGLSNLIQSGDSPSAVSYNVEYEVDPELVLLNAETNLSSSSNEINRVNVEPVPSTTRTRSVADLYNELAEKTKAQNEKLQEGSSQSASVTSSPNSTRNENSNIIRLQLKPLVIPEDGGDKSKCTVVSGGGMKSVVVQQHIVSSDPSSCDSTYAKPIEILRKDTAILGPDGKVICTAPGKGIEQVVTRLTAQLKALEEKEAKKMAALAKSTIICNVCKTVFDSDKALRQHKRESLYCGKIWGFKSANHDKSTSVGMQAASETSICDHRIKLPSDGNTDTTTAPGDSTGIAESFEEKDHLSSAQSSTTQSVRLSRFISPPKPRRASHHPQNCGMPSKSKRNLSPVKKIKLKYIKLDSSLSSSSTRDFENRIRIQGGGGSSYSCHRCSASFTWRHEMSMHLALCTGVINYAYQRDMEPPQEKIRISMRNDFTEPSTSIPTPQASPSFNSTTSESQNNDLPNRQRQVSGTSSSRGDTPNSEVNNNKQYKVNYQPHASSGISASSSSEEEDTMAVVPTPELEMLSVRLVEEEGDSDITSHDSGVSSASSSRKKTKLLLSSSSSGGAKKVKTLSNSSSSTKNVTKSPSTKTTKMIGAGGIVSERLDAKKTVKKTKADTTKSKQRQKSQSCAKFNLRKTVQSRIRKSRRVLRPPSPLKQQRRKQQKQQHQTTPTAKKFNNKSV